MITRNSLLFTFYFLSQLLIAQNATKEVPPVIPYWAFGHWVWEDEKNTRSAVETLTEGYIKHNIPVSAIIIDSPWMTNYNDFEPDSAQYPRLPDMINNLHKKGIRVLAFYTGCINSSTYGGIINSSTYGITKGKCKTFDYVVSKNYAINNNKESTWWKGKGVHYDATNDKAKAWWHSQVEKLHTMNFNGAKIDYGFTCFGDSVLTSKGLMSKREFGYYYYADAFDYNTSRNDEFVAMTYAWSGFGLIGFPSKSHVNWVGDFRGDWIGIKDQLKNIYLSANYGFSGIGCEIGGYWGVASNKEQFIRYTQLSSLCPIMINGGWAGAFAHHLPWNYDEETLSIYRQFVSLHNELSYYLFSTAVDAHLKQSTILKECSIEKESHLLGDQLFVKVISDSLPKTSVHLPTSGKWADLWTDSIYAPNSINEREYPLSQYPIFIKIGAILPLKVSGNLWQHGSENDNGKITFLIYPDTINSYLFHKPVGSGIKYSDILVSVNNANGKISVNSETSDEFVFLVKCQNPPKQIENADKWNYIPEQRLVRIEKSGKQFEITLKIK